MPRGIGTCKECGRVFDLFDEMQSEEFYYGHDCVPSTEYRSKVATVAIGRYMEQYGGL